MTPPRTPEEERRRPIPEFKNADDFRDWMQSAELTQEHVRQAERVGREQGWLTDKGWVWHDSP